MLSKIILAAVSLLLALILGECLVRIINPPIAYPLAAQNIFRSVDSRVGYTLIPNLNTSAFQASLRTNSAGFRGPEWTIPKPNKTFRIALIGDSLTFGYGLEEKDTYGQVLKQLLEARGLGNVEILNFGVNGYNSLQEQALLEKYVLPYGPDMIILTMTANDDDMDLWADSAGRLRWGNKNASRSGTVANAWSQYLKKSIEGAEKYRFLMKSRLFTFLLHQSAFYRHRLSVLNQPENTEKRLRSASNSTANFSEHLKSLQSKVGVPVSDMIKACAERNIPILVALYAKEGAWLELAREIKERHPEIHMINLLSLYPENLNHKEFVKRYTLVWDPHPNAAANALWAKALADLIINQGLAVTRPKRDNLNIQL